MATVMKISPQGQIRIPKKFLKLLGIETGDYIEAVIENNQIALKPRKLIDPSQGWFWETEWRKAEAEVDQQIERGEISPKFHTAEEGLKWLKK